MSKQFLASISASLGIVILSLYPNMVSAKEITIPKENKIIPGEDIILLESMSLQQIYDATSVPHIGSHCTFPGVRCNTSGLVESFVLNLNSTTFDAIKFQQAITEQIGNLTSLKTLSLSNAKLTSIPSSIENLSSLITLQLSDNLIKTLPAEIGKLPHLKTLILRMNLIASLPKEIGQLNHLAYLDLTGNYLTDVPLEMNELNHLEQLFLGDNILTTLSFLPTIPGKMSSLIRMNVTNNFLSLFENFEYLSNLRYLDLADNQIKGDIPISLDKVTSLMYLDVSYNKLTNTNLPPLLDARSKAGTFTYYDFGQSP